MLVKLTAADFDICLRCVVKSYRHDESMTANTDKTLEFKMHIHNSSVKTFSMSELAELTEVNLGVI